MEKELKKLKECIENIEQLGANARYFQDYEQWERVDIELYSILHWAKKGQRLIKKITESGVENNE